MHFAANTQITVKTNRAKNERAYTGRAMAHTRLPKVAEDRVPHVTDLGHALTLPKFSWGVGGVSSWNNSPYLYGPRSGERSQALMSVPSMPLCQMPADNAHVSAPVRTSRGRPFLSHAMFAMNPSHLHSMLLARTHAPITGKPSVQVQEFHMASRWSDRTCLHTCMYVAETQNHHRHRPLSSWFI